MNTQSKNPGVMWANAGKLADLVASEGVDILHARSRAPAWSALWAARRTGIKAVTTYHGAYGGGSAVKRLYNSSMVRGDLVIANSAYTAQTIRQTYRVAPERLAVIPRGVDVALFSAAAVTAARMDALRAAWDIPPDAFLALLPARLTSWKGHLVAIEAAARLCASAALKAGLNGAAQGSGDIGRRLRVVFCGDAQGRDAHASSLAKAIEAAGLTRTIRLAGHCADMPAAYALADIVLAPSVRPEAFGRTAIEAGAMGRPAIAADHGGARETIDDGRTGALVPPGDSEALAEAIEQMVVMGVGGRAAMGALARARIVQRFSTDAMAQATLAAYEDVCALGSGRRSALRSGSARGNGLR